jgi:hypothetical protein
LLFASFLLILRDLRARCRRGDGNILFHSGRAGIFVWMSQIEFALHHKLLFGFGSEEGVMGAEVPCATDMQKRMEFLTSTHTLTHSPGWVGGWIEMVVGWGGRGAATSVSLYTALTMSDD